MKKYAVILLGILLFLVSCASSDQAVVTSYQECVAAGYEVQGPDCDGCPRQCIAPEDKVFFEFELRQCTEEAMVCPDGTAVGRIPPDCEFAPCPNPDCDYNDPDKEFVANDPGTCNVVMYQCEKSRRPFVDECGCGCELIKDISQEKSICEPSQRNADVCIEVYDPVCGWFNEDIQCIRYPCAATYTNSCFACRDKQVAYWTEGQCPEG